jgi:hypothetical protein
MSEHLNYAGPVQMQPGPPHSPGPTMILPNMQRSISHPGYATVYRPLQLPPGPYDGPSWQQHLNVEGIRSHIPPMYNSSATTTPPSTYAAPTPMPQTWFQLATARNIGFGNFLGQFPMNVPLPDTILDYLSGSAPALGYGQLASLLSHAYAQSQNVQPLSNPSIADPSTITSRYMDTTDFSKVPWTYMDASHALPLPQMSSANYDVYTPDPAKPDSWLGGRM